jgi:PadR family transcriptional regulator, regulatory protein PadR
VKRTHALLQVAATLMADSAGRHYGYEIYKETGLRSGVLYPILHRLLDEGWVTDGWEDPPATGRRQTPPRRYYELTDIGRRELGAMSAPVNTSTRRRPASRPVLRPGM